MKKTTLPSLKLTLHQIAVGLIITVPGTVLAMWIWTQVDVKPPPENQETSIGSVSDQNS